MNLIRLGLLAGLIAAAAPSAFADYYTAAAGLQCRGDVVAIRFGGASNDEPPEFYDLPAAYAAGWAKTPFAEDNRCKLANGAEVVLRWGEEQAYGWGMGGADPSAFFSLWIDGRRVFSREQFKSGYASSDGYLNSVFVSPAAKEICSFPRLDDPRANDSTPPVTCASKPFRVDSMPPDPELPGVEDFARIGTITVAATHSEQFCRRFIEPREASNPSLPREGIAIPSDAQQFFQRGEEDVFPPKRVSDRMAFVQAHATFDYFDLWNTGKSNTVVRFFGDWKFFNGDVLFYRQADTPEAEIREVMVQAQEPGSGTHYYKDLAKKYGWQTITENPDVYEHWTPFRLSGVTYLMQHKTYGSQWTLYRPSPKGALTTVCVFQMIEDYF